MNTLFLDLNETTGKLFSNMEELAVDDVAKDIVLAKKLFIVDQYWSGLKSKEDILQKTKDDIIQHSDAASWCEIVLVDKLWSFMQN